MNENIREILCSMGLEGALVFDNPDYDPAIIGYTDEGRVVYDFDKMVEHLAKTGQMSEIDAIEFIEYNTVRSMPYDGEKSPIIVYPIFIE